MLHHYIVTSMHIYRHIRNNIILYNNNDFKRLVRHVNLRGVQPKRMKNGCEEEEKEGRAWVVKSWFRFLGCKFKLDFVCFQMLTLLFDFVRQVGNKNRICSLLVTEQIARLETIWINVFIVIMSFPRDTSLPLAWWTDGVVWFHGGSTERAFRNDSILSRKLSIAVAVKLFGYMTNVC